MTDLFKTFTKKGKSEMEQKNAIDSIKTLMSLLNIGVYDFLTELHPLFEVVGKNFLPVVWQVKETNGTMKVVKSHAMFHMPQAKPIGLVIGGKTLSFQSPENVDSQVAYKKYWRNAETPDNRALMALHGEEIMKVLEILITRYPDFKWVNKVLCVLDK